MKNFCKNIKRDQEGVTTVFAAIMLSSFMILAGLGVDLGLVYYAKHRLAENARLASLAGASVLNPTIGSSTYRATAQSVLDNNIGLVKIMTIKSTTISADCL
jgi:Flp pilus assembly protein TadG